MKKSYEKPMEYVVKLNCERGMMTVISVDDNATDEENSEKVREERDWSMNAGKENIWEREWP